MSEPSDAEGFRPLLLVAELPPGEKRAFDLGGKSVLVCNVQGAIHAVENVCTHAGIALASGRLRGCVIECPLHGGKFDLRDGRPVAGPPRKPLPRFEVRIVKGRIAVRVD